MLPGPRRPGPRRLTGPTGASHLGEAPPPFEPGHALLQRARQGRRLSSAARAPADCALMVNVSERMAAHDRLPLAEPATRQPVEWLDARDRVAPVTYAGSTRVVLPSTSAGERGALREAIDASSPGGGAAEGQRPAAGLRRGFEAPRGRARRRG